MHALSNPSFQTPSRWLLRMRRPAVVVFHLALVALSSYVATWLRFDGQIPPHNVAIWLQFLPLLLAIRAVTFVPFGLYSGLWRYASISDLADIIGAVSISSSVFYLAVRVGFGVTSYPRSVHLLDTILLISLMGGARLTRRVLRWRRASPGTRRVLVFGAGDAGEMIVRDMRHNAFYGYEPIGFVDDDQRKVGQRIHGLPVRGTRADLPRVIADSAPDEILIALPRCDGATIRGIVRSLEPFNLKITTLPNLRDLLDGNVRVNQIRQLSIEDLLARAPVGLDPRPIQQLIAGKCVMVTGAGGSIGSELCRQILDFRPRCLVLYERYENSMFALLNAVGDKRPAAPLVPAIGDVTDRARLRAVMEEHRPDIVFHAAAHKHVPLMEQNPCEAVKNNVGGTRAVAEVARRCGVSRLVMISTDKAVNPTSVMGATKRVAELFLQSIANGGGGTRFTIVRFGNVLGSNGSVVPRFLEQIKAGGPVTVTHPDMRRYFMLIPEAVHLVLHAAALAEGGEVFVLEMGEQIKVLDMARNLIRLSGRVPEDDIPIVFTGLRPGEKLFEELVGTTETAEPCGLEKILRIRRDALPPRLALERGVSDLQRLAARGDTSAVLIKLGEIVPTYREFVASEGAVLAGGRR